MLFRGLNRRQVNSLAANVRNKENPEYDRSRKDCYNELEPEWHDLRALLHIENTDCSVGQSALLIGARRSCRRQPFNSASTFWKFGHPSNVDHAIEKPRQSPTGVPYASVDLETEREVVTTASW